MTASVLAKLLASNSKQFGRSIFFDALCISSCRYWTLQSLEYKQSLHTHSKQTSFHVQQIKRHSSTEASIRKVTDQYNLELETLYRAVDLLVIGHEKSVLESFLSFCETAAGELDITLNDVLHPRSIFDRMTLLKSIHIYKKHRVQYESRTHRKVLQLKYLTSSTANVYLEYIQRNIPAGVALHVQKWEIEKFPDHILKKIEENAAKMTDEDWNREYLYMEKMKMPKDTSPSDYEEYETTKNHLIGTTM